MNIFTTIRRARQTFYGWRILAASGIIGAVGSGLSLYGFSVFFLPISESLGLSRAATSFVFSLSRAEGSIEGPVAGYFIDRLGPRKVILAAVVMMGAGYILLSRVDSFLTFLIVYMGIISLGFNAGIMSVPIAVINYWFIRRRGLAMGIVTACFGLGGALIAPTLSLCIAHFGWRTTAFLSGIVVIGTLIPLTLVFRRSPESMGLLPDGDTARTNGSGEAEASSVPAAVDFTVGEALRTTSFWVLTIATCLRIGAHMGFIVHFVPIMVWKGTDEPGAAIILGTLALLSIPFRILLGWAGDRIPKSRVVAMGSGAGAISLVFLNYIQPGGWQFWIFLVLIAIGESVGPLNWGILGDFFGRQRYATIRGAMVAFTGIAAAATPVISGILYDNSQSYEMTLWITSGLFALSAVVFAILRHPNN